MDIPDRQLPPGAWAPAKRAAERLASPIHSFLAIEAASGILLMLATVAALVWANSGWSGAYADLWHTSLGVQLGSWSFVRPLHFWVNDGLMTIFFFVVGLEIRREAYEGELAGLKKAALPIAAAMGGMLVPAAIYAAFNAGRAGIDGWGIAMATDIAFAVGVLTLLGRRVSASLRMLLLALAVIDDIGAILVIAIFYTAGIQPEGLILVAVGIVIIYGLQLSGIRASVMYAIPGVVIWAGLYWAGVHPTLAGVLLGLLTPVRPWYGRAGFAQVTRANLDDLEGDVHVRLAAIEEARREAISPAERLQHMLHPWVAFAIMPLFALANAGVALGGASLTGDGLFVFVGIVLGLALGKPLGIYAAGAALRGKVSRSGLLVVGIVGGIGFTMSLFVAQLAFPPGPLLDTAKLGILVGSAAAIVFGLLVGLLALRGRGEPAGG